MDSRSGGSAADEMFGITRQGNDLDPIRDEAVDILRMQYKRGNNGYVKTKYVTLTIEAENLPAARARFARIETDTLNRFKVMGAAAHVLDGKERLELLYNILHPEGGQFAFEWDWLPASGLSVKDFISPSSFHFGETRTFRIGRRYGAVSFLQILAPEMHDRILTDFMEADGNIMVTMHIRGINQNEAIKMVKRKITDLDAMKIQEQKRAVRSGYDMDILPSDLSTYGGAAKDLLTDLQSRNERMFNMTFLVLHTAETRQKLEIAVSQAASVAQTYNCLLTRLDFQQEDGLMSSLAPGPQPHQDRTEPDHFGSGGVRPLRHPGGVHGRRRHVLRAQRPLQQHDPAGPQAIPLSQRPCVRHPRQRQIHELQAGDHLYHADDPG